ncbi:Ribosomal large subunit pseudouridine synthase C [Planctomycetes bacterium Pla163]|uniref:Ribosomal large subunit pseudouridine synthase C n=1 Tax=Rohdeia mirabilis TaxID=2528008 RepID=A0A518D226_9BACT|nr:Ribosomal large subunit pseudouridine synthase C [Planctomycetes bacterium Pla163]
MYQGEIERGETPDAARSRDLRPESADAARVDVDGATGHGCSAHDGAAKDATDDRVGDDDLDVFSGAAFVDGVFSDEAFSDDLTADDPFGAQASTIGGDASLGSDGVRVRSGVGGEGSGTGYDSESGGSVDYLVVEDEHDRLEIDEYLCLVYPGVAKGALREEVRSGRVTVDGQRVQPSHRLRAGSVLSASISDEVLLRQRHVDADPLPVLWENDDCAVVDKPPGIAVEPERWAREGACVADGLLAWSRAAADGALPSFRPRLAHRLDKDTSGALLVAKSLESERRLRSAFASGHTRKEYLALVEGVPNLEDGEVMTIDLALAEDVRRPGRMRVDRKHGKPSRTDMWIERRFDGFSLVRCRLHTGRTHQIRVHLAEIGLPLLVDPFYGRRDALLLSSIKRGYRSKRGRVERPLIDRLTLHADTLVFLGSAPTDEQLAAGPAPIPAGLAEGTSFTSGPWVGVRAPLPPDLTRVLKQLAKVRPARR